MKSIIRKAQPIVVAYNLSDEKFEGLAEICAKNSIKLKNALLGDANQQVGYICEFSGFSSNSTPCENPPQNECLIFSGFHGTALNNFLAQLNSNNIAVTLKAICTPANLSWTIYELIDELAQEHNTLLGGSNG